MYNNQLIYCILYRFIIIISIIDIFQKHIIKNNYLIICIYSVSFNYKLLEIYSC